jgi:uncharacterized membrane protein (DUF485 family)
VARRAASPEADPESTLMSDHDDKREETVDDVDERLDNIARVVKDYLREGDAFLIQCQEDDIIVEEAPQSRFQKEHPRLYGRLLSLEDQLETGCGITIVLFVLGGIVCLALHAGWLDDVLTPNVTQHLATWWVYVAMFVVLFFVSDWLYTRVARRVYRRGREELLMMMREEGLDRDTVVTLLKGSPEFDKIAKQLKLDPGPFRFE